ncbi:hypothetical protein LLEC1_03410 [Akanthomyces lecanii]|uniref:Uncharacterized protein n=1 Tax=Cordyceps confragosa TaxID=2714763 RepID=A0A179IKP1_CORDF|nr:hypothetical protein LLEC1_03410 [Akanthomyces lecanii]
MEQGAVDNQHVADKTGSSLPSGSKEEVTPNADGNAAPQREATFQDYLRLFKYANTWDFVAYAAGAGAAIGSGVTLPLLNVVFGRKKTFIKPDSFANLISAYRKIHYPVLCLRWNRDTRRWPISKPAKPTLVRHSPSHRRQLAFRMIGLRISAAIRQDFLKALFSQSVHVLDSMPPGYATTVITSSSNTVQLGISEKLGVFLEFNATMIASIIVAFVYSWQLSLVTFTAVVFIVLCVGIALPPITKGSTLQGQSEAKSTSIASEALSSLRMVVACGAEARIGIKYSRFVDEAKKHAQSVGPLIAIQFGLIFFSSYAAFGLAFWYGTKLLVEHKINELGAIVIVLFSVMMIVASMERTSGPLLAISKAMVAACEFFTVIDAPRPDPGHLAGEDISATEDLVLENVTFAYPSRPHVKVLDNLSLTFERGKVTALVGPSGCGKSTIVGLLERWYNLTSQHIIPKTVEKGKEKTGSKKSDDKSDDNGQELKAATTSAENTGPPIELGGQVSTCGRSLDKVNVKWWRSQIGLVQQEPFLFNDTIYSNVVSGLAGTKWENEAENKKRQMVRDACMKAYADEFIEKLKEGYDTPVGDSGTKLSGGQRQRIAIARAIIRQPSILILDEATSAIDVRGEGIVQAALDRVSKNRTTITIAHRLSTIKKADRIVVLRQGQVIESGTHESLVANKTGLYHDLVNAQSLSLGESTEPDNLRHQERHISLAREQGRVDPAKTEEVATTDKKDEVDRNLFSAFGRFLYETKSNWWMMALALVFAACSGAGIPIQSWLFAKVIIVFSYFPDAAKVQHESAFWSLMWTVLAIAAGVSYFATFLFANRAATNIRAKYQKQLFSSILYQKIAFFDEDQHSQGTMTARSTTDPKQLEEVLGTNMASVFVALFTLIGSLTIAFAFAWKLALVSFFVVVPILLGTGHWRIRYEIKFDEMSHAVFADSSKFASEAIGAFRTVASLTLEDTICERFRKLANGHVTDAYKEARWVTLLFAFSDSATIGCQALIFWYGGRLLLRGEFSLESFFVCFISVLNAGETTGKALGFGPNVAQAGGAAKRILGLRDTQVKDDPTAGRESFKTNGEGMKIELDDITFRYPTRDLPVFNGLSLTIEKGQFAALVGASGCGKSSIISLLQRFYDLDHGRILCDGKDITFSNVYAYRSHLSLVAQESSLIQGTLRENILLGVDESTVTDEMIHEVCRQASIHDFIVSLPEGCNTDIGSRGVSLSGGQRQRVSIARALIRNPDILLLDEATSALDSESEKQVQAALERAAKGRTMVAVAHRLATVQNADVIFVLGDGKLLERGNHQELLATRGVYWQMCQSQALDR